MTDKILVPIDLEHAEKLNKALGIAATIAKAEDAEVCYLGVTTSAPSGVASTPEAFAKKMEAFAEDQAKTRGVAASAKAVTAHDVTVQLEDVIIDGAKEAGADLIVMASHIPGVAEHVFATHAGYVANHAPVSVYVVR